VYSIEGVVVFRDSDSKHWIMKYLKPGFRHCYICVKCGGHYIAVNGIDSFTDLAIIENLEEITNKTDKILQFSSKININFYRGGLNWFNCVEVVKSHMGIKSLTTFTPYQLYKLMVKGMGSKTSFDVRRMVAPGSDEFGSGNPLKILKSSVQPDGPIRFSSGKTAKERKAAQEQQKQIDMQRQKEESRLAALKGDVAKRKAMAKGKGAGRSLLTATSPTGVNNLGG